METGISVEELQVEGSGGLAIDLGWRGGHGECVYIAVWCEIMVWCGMLNCEALGRLGA